MSHIWQVRHKPTRMEHHSLAVLMVGSYTKVDIFIRVKRTSLLHECINYTLVSFVTLTSSISAIRICKILSLHKAHFKIGATTLSITALSLMTLSPGLNASLSINDTQLYVMLKVASFSEVLILVTLSVAFVLLFWVSLCWMLLCLVSWRLSRLPDWN